MIRDEAGFTLIEVIVAFAIVCLVLTGLYQSLATAYRNSARTALHEQTLALGRAHLDAIGVAQPLAPGATEDVYPTGVKWRLLIEAVDSEGQKPRAFRIVLEPLDRNGAPLFRLETFKLSPRSE